MTNSILFYLNGQKVQLTNPDLDQTLLQYLRSTGLTGTKLGCGEGGCGACTVMVSRYDTDQQKVVHASVNACLCPLYTIDGKHVITVEGLGSANNPHPVQERIALLHGSQCGFCTPGFVMSLYTLLRNNPEPSELDIEECFDGNLCRCTGYRPILDAAKTFADQAWKAGARVQSDGTAKAAPETSGKGCGIEGCCQEQKAKEDAAGCCGGKQNKAGGCCKTKTKTTTTTTNQNENEADAEKAAVISRFQSYDPTKELIFPPYLIRYAKGTTTAEEHQMQALEITKQDGWCQKFYRPVQLDALLEIMKEHPAAKMVAGNSEVGVEIKLKKSKYPVQVYVNDIPELRAINETADGVVFGANITLARFEHTLESLVDKHGAEKTQSLAALRENLRYFAGKQIRNVATIAGNIATASPISDLNPVFLASGAVVTVASKDNGRREIPMSKFFLGYRRTAMQAGEVLVSVRVPFNPKGEIVRAFKQAKRKDDDIAIVTCGMRVRVDQKTGEVLDCALGYGGMSVTTVLAQKTQAVAQGAKWGDRQTIDSMVAACQEELRLDYTVPGGMAEYRNTLAISFLFKFWALSCKELGLAAEDQAVQAAHEMEDGERSMLHGQQQYATVRDRAIVGKGVAHMSALKQVTGEARYVDDMPQLAGELHIAMVMSPHAHARLLSIDASAALDMEGVDSVLTSKDIPGHNLWNIFKDEEILPTEEVHYCGQPVALVLASTQKQAQEAARQVQVEYEALPAVLSVRQAVAEQSFFAEERCLVNGDVEKAFGEADHVFEGESYCGPQEHFYLETMGSLAVPKGEGGEVDIFASTQNPTEAQMVCAEVLGVPANRVVCHVKRMGGGFGGKESRSVLIAAFTALGAHCSGRSVRLMLDRDEDMMTSGQRHPFYGTWKVAVTKEGKMTGLRARIYSNGGFSHDLSMGVLERAVSHFDNCYRIANTDFVGRVCKTNTQSNTAFRSFGGCQGMILMESMLCEVAEHLGMAVEHLREINMYKLGDVTPFSQKLDDWNVPRMWDELKQKAQYEERRQAIDKFNAAARYRKRGLAMLPTKFGISFGVKHLNQGMALVHVYMDGSVLVAHGGTEMGQGLHTKMAQVAAETLELPLDSVFISETATHTAANTSPTAASASSDLNGFAVYNACKVLADRLRPYREKMAGEPFSKIAKVAYLDRCNLTAAGHYATPDIGFDWQKNEGLLYFYFTQGVALAEVELDTLTGAHTTRRVDITMDVGRSLNKAIDIGQIEGAFAQGQGWSTTEEFLYFSNGRLFTQGPGNYKIPSAMDIARDFRVELLENAEYPNLKTIFSSKGIGEPPLFLGASVFFALRDAVLAARKLSPEAARTVLHIEPPATPELLRLSCEDELVQMARIPGAKKEGRTPFAIRI